MNQTMTREQAFLEAILDDPDDDTPRLIFADWLSEHGEDDYGSFIRVQCELATLERQEVELFNEDADWSECTGIAASWCPNCGDCYCACREDSMSDNGCPLHDPRSRHCCLDDLHDKQERLRRRERELLEAHFAEWTPQLPCEDSGYLLPSGCTVKVRDEHFGRDIAFTFRRGFVAEVSLTCADFVGGACSPCRGSGAGSGFARNCSACQGTGRTPGHAGAIFSCCPIEKVTLTDKAPLKSEGLEDFRWAEQRHPSQDDCWSVPPEIFRHLLPDINCVIVRDGPASAVRAYYSEENAQKGLSAACVKYGRDTRGIKR